MRKRTIKALRAVAVWTQRVLDVRLPMHVLYGLRPR